MRSAADSVSNDADEEPCLRFQEQEAVQEEQQVHVGQQGVRDDRVTKRRTNAEPYCLAVDGFSNVGVVCGWCRRG